MSMDSSTYYVMKHYSLSLSDIKILTQEEFSQMLIWAVANDEIQNEDAEKRQGDSQSKMKIGSTNMGGPMPHSEGW
jgi:hypothetical protein|tara:strand:- start:15905 stop:16132 length:228 start_codon:yes stop_codon:yes gene_type:complete